MENQYKQDLACLTTDIFIKHLIISKGNAHLPMHYLTAWIAASQKSII